MTDLFGAPKPVMVSEATLSDDRQHRYMLSRVWDDRPKIMFICLNPSRADALRTDATITRCINFSKVWGYGGMYFANLYSYRTPYVKGPISEDKQVEMDGPDKGKRWWPLTSMFGIAVGPECDAYLDFMAVNSEKVVLAWGAFGFVKERSECVMGIVKRYHNHIYCMGTNKDGSPKHPLYLSGETDLVEYRPEGLI